MSQPEQKSSIQKRYLVDNQKLIRSVSLNLLVKKDNVNYNKFRPKLSIKPFIPSITKELQAKKEFEKTPFFYNKNLKNLTLKNVPDKPALSRNLRSTVTGFKTEHSPGKPQIDEVSEREEKEDREFRKKFRVFYPDQIKSFNSSNSIVLRKLL